MKIQFVTLPSGDFAVIASEVKLPAALIPSFVDNFRQFRQESGAVCGWLTDQPVEVQTGDSKVNNIFYESPGDSNLLAQLDAGADFSPAGLVKPTGTVRIANGLWPTEEIADDEPGLDDEEIKPVDKPRRVRVVTVAGGNRTPYLYAIDKTGVINDGAGKNVYVKFDEPSPYGDGIWAEETAPVIEVGDRVTIRRVQGFRPDSVNPNNGRAGVVTGVIQRGSSALHEGETIAWKVALDDRPTWNRNEVYAAEVELEKEPAQGESRSLEHLVGEQVRIESLLTGSGSSAIGEVGQATSYDPSDNTLQVHVGSRYVWATSVHRIDDEADLIAMAPVQHPETD